MLIRHKIREQIRQKKQRRKTTETGWGNSRGSGLDSRSLLWALFVFLLVVVIAAWVWLRPAERPERITQVAVTDELEAGIEGAEKVARAFLAETAPRNRLQWVRNAEDVSARLMEYPEEARSAPGVIEEMLGHQVDGGRSLTGFVVRLPSGNLRLLEVVGTADGPKVDWDAYARHGTARWEDLLTGKARRAVVRVFCEPSSERPEPFEDQGKWTCFRLSSPDLPQAALGFTEVGSSRENMMRQVILGTPNYRQRFILEIVRHEGKCEPLFETVRCLAVGWVMDAD